MAQPLKTAAEGLEPLARSVRGVGVFRARGEAPPAVPVSLRSATHGTVAAGRFALPSDRRILLVEWVLSGEAAMLVDGRRVSFRPGDVAIYLPTVPFCFWAVAPESEMCWFTVDGPLAESLALHLGLQPGVHPCDVPPPVRRLHRMMDLLRSPDLRNARRASLLAIRMLYEVADAIRTTQVPSVVDDVQRLVREQFADPDLSVEALASKVSYHRGSLSRLFRQHTGLKLVDYISEVRLHAATALLQHAPDKIAEVARKCGFRDAAYFCRWVRKQSGLTPGEVRAGSRK